MSGNGLGFSWAFGKRFAVGDLITGTISGDVIQGVTVYILNSNTRQVVASGISDSFGNYSVSGLANGIPYDVLPMVEAHTFNPHLTQVTLTNSDVVLNFISISGSQYLFDDTTVSIVDESNNRLWEDRLFYNLFITESQGTTTPSVVTNDASLADWDWGDGNQTLDNNSPSHTYVAPFDPSYNVDIFDVDPLQIIDINLAGDGVIDVNLSAFPNVNNLTVNNNTGLNTLDISGLTGLIFLTTYNTNVGSSLNFTGLNSLFSFRSWNSGLTDSAIATLTSPAIDTLTIRSNPITTINLAPLTALSKLQIWNCALVGALDTSSNTNLTNLGVHNNTSLGALDISSNTLLIDFNISNTGRTSGEIDQHLIDLDGHGQTNGSFNYSSNPEVPTLASLTAYNNLIGKGWTITGSIPS